MPCFKGIAVSIHANGAPLAEYGVQKQSRVSRINSYIPVPQPQLNRETGKPEPAKFAISITLLTNGLAIPYSVPRPNDDNPHPKPQYVGVSPTDSGSQQGMVSPYINMTNSENETIAAYIYFDGRSKEEVATLLRPGEETWVNSRWVHMTDSSTGTTSLAEREFLFREVGLEKWLNGLDLQGHDAADKLERRRQKFEKRRKRQKDAVENGLCKGISMEENTLDSLDDESSDDDDDEPPEAAGQIKVAMFRVIASGEIKKGEYSPQFDAREDDDELDGLKNAANASLDAEIEHTTSFAKPKSLDPKTISTQTVTGIDGPEKPYAVFTFFYRGERQLGKMGILSSSKVQPTTPATSKRRSGQLDFSKFGPLKTAGTVGFSTFRDTGSGAARRKKSRKKTNGSPGAMDEDSDEDDDDESDHLPLIEDELDEKNANSKLGSEEEAKFASELAANIDRIRLKRAHSADLDSAAQSRNLPTAGALSVIGEGTLTNGGTSSSYPPAVDSNIFSQVLTEPGDVGSPLKKVRACPRGSPSGDISANLAGVLAKVPEIASDPQATMEEEEL